MKALKTIVSSLAFILLLCSGNQIKTEISTYNLLQQHDITLGHTLLNSKFLKNMYLYASDQDPLKKLIQILWSTENKKLIPTQKGPFAAITPELFEHILTHIYANIPNNNAIDNCIDINAWVKAYKKQIPEIIKLLEQKKKIIQDALQQLYWEKRTAKMHYTRAMQAKINNSTYKNHRWAIQQEERQAKKRLDRKRAPHGKQADYNSPLPETYQKLNAHLHAKIQRNHATQSQYVHNIDEQGLNEKATLIAIQQEEQQLTNTQKELNNAIATYSQYDDEAIRQDITQNIKKLLQIIKEAISYEYSSELYFPRTTESILWAFFEDKFGNVPAQPFSLAKASSYAKATEDRLRRKNVHLAFNKTTHHLLYNFLDVEDDIQKIHVIKNATKHKEQLNKQTKQFIHKLANSVSDKKCIQKICKYILKYRHHLDTRFMNYIIAHPHETLLQLYNMESTTEAINICKVITYVKQYINKKDEDGNTPLFNAIAHQKTELIKIFLYAGADPDIKKDGKTALMECITKLMKKQQPLDENNKKIIHLLVSRSDLSVTGKDFLNTEKISEQYKDIHQNSQSEDIHDFLVEKILEKAQYQQELHMKVRQLEYEIQEHTQTIEQHKKDKATLEIKADKIKNKQQYWSILEKNNKNVAISIAQLKEKIIKAKQMIKKHPKQSARLIQQVIKSLKTLKAHKATYENTEKDIQSYKNSVIQTENQIVAIGNAIKNLMQKIITSEENKEDLIDELF